jgi:hypothetical protein
MDNSRLRRHLLRNHRRSGPEFAAPPLADRHRFEHVERSMGLNALGHWHAADGIGHRPDHPER